MMGVPPWLVIVTPERENGPSGDLPGPSRAAAAVEARLSSYAWTEVLEHLSRYKGVRVFSGLFAPEDLDDGNTLVLRDDEGLAWRVGTGRCSGTVGSVAEGHCRAGRRR